MSGRALLWLAWLFSCIAPVLAAQTAAPREEVLVLGRISDDPRRDYEGLKPLLDYVVARMGDVGIHEGRILMARDTAQMAGYLRRQRVDWATDTAATATEYQRRGVADAVLVADRGGVFGYHSVVFTWRGSGISTLADLKGRSIAFQNITSTSGFVLPAAQMLRNGLELEVLLSPDDRPHPDNVGYVFAGKEENLAVWVQKRIVDAGAFSNLDWGRLSQLPASFRDELQIVHESHPAPRGLELVAHGLAPQVRSKLVQVLLQAGEDPQAREPLQHYFGVTHFAPVDATMQRDLDRIGADVELVRQRLE